QIGHMKKALCKLVRSLKDNDKINQPMKTLIAILLWFILLMMCWPVALALIFILPIIWLLLLPFRIVGFTLELVFKLISSILLLPFKLLKVA
ncbi:MAG: hypothetical protein ACK55U_10795, partial [Bacteroidota bacterium]